MMRIHSLKAFRFDHPKGGERFVVRPHDFVDAPDWVKDSLMFKLASADGDVSLVENKVDEAKADEDSAGNGPTVKELREQAKELGVEGFAKLKKDELLQAIEEAKSNAGE